MEYVYFITCNVPGVGPLVKIGHTNGSVYTRMDYLQTGNPLVLDFLGCVEGGLKVESSLHYDFQNFHFRGEWFLFTGNLEDRINRLLSESGVRSKGAATKRRFNGKINPDIAEIISRLPQTANVPQ